MLNKHRCVHRCSPGSSTAYLLLHLLRDVCQEAEHEPAAAAAVNASAWSPHHLISFPLPLPSHHRSQLCSEPSEAAVSDVQADCHVAWGMPAVSQMGLMLRHHPLPVPLQEENGKRGEAGGGKWGGGGGRGCSDRPGSKQHWERMSVPQCQRCNDPFLCIMLGEDGVDVHAAGLTSQNF